MAQGTGVSFSGNGPEIPDCLNRTILTATFTRHRSVLSSSEFSIYTEVTLHVHNVFEDRTGMGRPVTHKDVTAMLSGGTVALSSGRILSDKVVPRTMFLEPDHMYLLVMSYHQSGDFYTLCDDWDISNGTVQPNTERAQYYAKSGHSSLSGLNVQQLGPALDKELYRQK
jgi:hypothetical protein